jgi:EAL domain-containing protein (putative c-di-GMP-specific phosphodiesterase class I)
VLRDAGCDEAQGFCLSHPLGPPEFRAFALRWDPSRDRSW